MLASPSHPRIQVEAKQDILFLKKGFQDYAAQLQQQVKASSGEHEEITAKLHKAGSEYEPLDEALRQKADDLSNQVQAKMVKIATMRKTLPGQIDDLNRETIRLLTSTTDKSHIEPDPAAGKPGQTLNGGRSRRNRGGAALGPGWVRDHLPAAIAAIQGNTGG
ncbi:hypothetical protein HDU91_007253 [Kappamyces sp. JEL0680]|nr:hypothetical protein HDU91_007253 [Kappamyces sp. JEL0680]